ncbi:lasso peptide isopeptide bond-forming cyclase [Streptomyces sp. UNOC14_S4]|uniref:lasso peptide isopeptide bond-forming cyclase n=1 Tax=Streptomyces sp. UNOC14_S4 TaxID=2872340 RepID=UPI001E3179B9|nr:lasso peptide isopeptide bond-forming cyclase [Streptomyces sp. UNOC14_S4]MCC3767860.1 lasso peptide isopeptide bond-forming cyclase [Streptomyces sp. UNOC14_S4]
MDQTLSLQTVPAWFVVLPDTDAAAPLARAVLPYSHRTLCHASGRPWIVGRWAPDAMVVGEHGDTRVAVTGEHAVTPWQARRASAAVAGSRSPDALDRAADWPGSFHLVVSRGGDVHVQGCAVGLRRVFRTTATTATPSGTALVNVAADRADVLAELTGAELDPCRVAFALLTHGAPYPWAGEPLWRGLYAVPGGHRLTLTADGRARTACRWSPPDPVLPLAEGAVRLREALVEAVGIRTRGRDLISTDLGGLDSTAVCCAAARGEAKVVAYTAGAHDVAGDDVYWARRTVGALEGAVEHHVVSAADMALTFDGIDTLADVLDTPSIAIVDRNRRMGIVELAAARGSGLHLTGLGGDELLAGTPARLHTLLLRHPRTAARAVRGYAAKYQWARRETLGQLLDRRGYASWAERVARELTAPESPPEEPLLDWAVASRMPPWATADAVAVVRERLSGGPAAPPRGRNRGEHRELVAMDSISQWARHIGQMAAPLGIGLSAPYYDTRVIDAALAVRTGERITPWRYKPLIVEAMRGVVPEASRTRATKANATLEEEAGLRDHRRALLALCEDSRLARLGLVDARVLRDWCRRSLTAETGSCLLHATIACEVWLRSREMTPRPATGHGTTGYGTR